MNEVARAAAAAAAKKVAAAKPRFPPEDIAAIQAAIGEVLASGRLILGPRTEQFEEAFRAYVGAEHAVAVSTGTAALQIAFRHHQIAGREVILPTNNFIGVVGAVIAEGGVPVLVDMDPGSFCMDADEALSGIGPKTAGIVAVHIAGRIDPAIVRLRAECDRRGIFLIEDAAHAHGASLAGRKAGVLAPTACFSFYPTKVVTTGTGGMITTNDAALAKLARSVRHHGVGAGGLDDVVRFGNDWCLGEINAVLGTFQLRRLDENVAHRNAIVDRYRGLLGACDWLAIPSHPAEVRHAYYKFPVLLREGMDRDRFRKMLWTDHMIENGGIYDPPCHLQPVMRDRGFGPGAFPKAEKTLARQLCPPIHSQLTPAEADRVAAAMIEVAARCA
ncbi:MAG TPA: DegT/DnrJ/EryC1/StrS family aminotransferase [Usitatibacter sp.]|nr:DegT/DnrJ/EryC1/StrS family aminotransferase [Usitatibacter sp.]